GFDLFLTVGGAYRELERAGESVGGVRDDYPVLDRRVEHDAEGGLHNPYRLTSVVVVEAPGKPLANPAALELAHLHRAGRGTHVQPEHGVVALIGRLLDRGPHDAEPSLRVVPHRDVGIHHGAGALPRLAPLLIEDCVSVSARLARDPAADARTI